MKTWKKIILTIGVAACLTGVALATLGYLSGGMKDLSASYVQKNKQKITKKELTSFDQIDIDSKVYNAVIGQANISKPFISYANRKKLKIDYKVENGKLTVHENSDFLSTKKTVNFFTLDDLINILETGTVTDSHTLVISLPKGSDIKSIKASLSAGDLSMNNLTVKQADIKLSAGDLDTQDTKINSGKIMVAAGDAYFSNSNLSYLETVVKAGDLDFETGSSRNSSFETSMGDFTGNDLTFKENNQVTTSLGDISITLASKDLTVLSNQLSEDVDITDQLNPKSNNKLTITSNSGDVSVQ